MAVLDVVYLLLNVLFGYVHAFYRLIIQPPRKNIKGKIVLVTGAGRGIGKCLAGQFAELGAKVVVVDINETEVQDTADEICSLGGTAHAYKCDISSCGDVKETARRVRLDVGHPDIVVNNAGIALVKGMLELTEEDVQKLMAVNVLSHFWVNKEFLPNMLDKNNGHIVTVASMAGKIGTPYNTAYCASKFACVGYTEALSEEIRKVHKKSGVQTSVVFPTVVNTPAVRNYSQIYEFKTGYPMMEADYVASCIIDGVLRSKKEIYVPSQGGSFDLFQALVPRRVREALLDFSGAGIEKKIN